MTLCEQVAEQLAALCPEAEQRPARTQTAFALSRTFAAVWSARQWLGGRGAECVLTVWLPAPDDSPSWKQVVQVRPGLWAHHLELVDADLDPQVRRWVAQAQDAAA